MIKISDCNNCSDRNCPQSTSNAIRWNCKTWRPPQAQKIAPLGLIALHTNAQSLYDSLKTTGLKFPVE